ncbi:MAG: SH3 domain-containing protein [Chloroflexi bacterium]|nr:SH3 domain-containing protein [Chloroflexota bacterium]
MKTSLRFVVVLGLCLSFITGLWISAPTAVTEARGAAWSVVVYNNKDLAGGPIWSGASPNVSYTWGAGAPVINGQVTGAPVDNFSVRFSASAFFTAGNYRFTVQVDDGARLYIDGLLVINQWTTGTFRSFQYDFNFTADGNHNIVVEMFDSVGDASIIANWALAVGPPAPTATTTCTGVPWYAEFYNGLDLSGSVIYTTTFQPSGLSQNWAQGTPGGAVPADNWSARFTRTINVPTDLAAGQYKFYAKADDNFRFTVDATVIFDKWDSWGGDLQTADVTLLTGSHTLKFEYRERSVDASIFLTWTPGSAQCPVIAPDGSAGGGGGGTGGTPQPTGVTATVKVALLNLRSEPSLTGTILAKLNQGTTYPVVGRTADSQWAQLNVNGQLGWVSVQYVTFAGTFETVPVVGGGGGTGLPAPVQPPQTASATGVTQGNLRIRSGPSNGTAQLGVIPWGAAVDILGKDEGHTWYQVRYAGLTGWSFAPWIKLTSGNFDLLPYTDGSQPPFPPTNATEGVIIQAFGNVRIRTGPGLQFPKVARAVWGTRLQVLARSSNGQWYKVYYGGDVVGWTIRTWYKVVQGDINSVPVADQ